MASSFANLWKGKITPFLLPGAILLLIALLPSLLLYQKVQRLTQAILPQVGKPIALEQVTSTPENISPKPADLQLNVASEDPKIKELVNKVFQHIYLPNGDVRVETIVKPDELRQANPIFYQYAKRGDMLLIYSDRAILYDPAIDRVLDVYHILNP